MVEMDRRPIRRNVAILADIAGADVVCGFACGIRPVVTARAIAGHAGMIEAGARPARGCVAILAGTAGSDVICRLAGRAHAVMTGGAGAQSL